ncbi:hypothetical protein TruAng_001538 [Truncatella angustata]|nr:hypothetical protein TruAng_001538 [Truncatella angustata]
MLFSSRGPLAVALAACSVASATPHALAPRTGLNLDLGLLSEPTSVDISLDTDLTGLTLVEGILVGAVVPPVAAVGAEVDLIVKCNKGYTKGDITASVSVQDLIPSLSLSLKDIEAYLDLDLYVGIATTVAVNLFTPVAPIQLPIIAGGLELNALVSVDLVLSLDAAIDVSAGVYIKLTEDALLEIDILKGEILKADFTGLAVKTLPIEVRIGCARVQADLRVRIQAGVVAAVDIDDLINDLIPLGIDLPDIGVGLELGVYANLVEYVGLFCDTPSCPLAKESYGLNVGVVAGLDVEVEDLLDLTLAPTVSVALLTLPTTTHCSQSGGTAVATLPPKIGVPLVSGTASVPATSTSNSGHESGLAGPSKAGSKSGTVTVSANGPTGTATTTYGSELVTSTVKSTAYYTITSCAASVANCPASYQSEQTVVKTIDVYTTVCPITASLTAPASYSSSAAAQSSSADFTIVTDVTTLVPCSSTATFTPPAGVTSYPGSSTPAASSPTKPAGSASTKPATVVSSTKPATGASSTKPGTSVSTKPTTGASSTKPVEYTISTVYSTHSYTITSCAASITNCPVGKTTTEVVAVSTTVCPVTETETGKTSATKATETYSAGSSSTKPAQSTHSAETSTKPAQSTNSVGTSTKPTQSTYPVENASTKPADSTYPVQSNTKPIESTTKPAQSITVPVESTTKPAQSTTVPVESATKPAQSTYPVESATKPAQSTTKPVESATKPGLSTYPVESATKPGQSTYPVESATKPGQSTYPVESATKPGQSTYPVESATKPAGSTYPVGGASSTKPVGGAPTISTYPAVGASSTKPVGSVSTQPASGYPGSSEAPYPTYPAGGNPSSGSGNGYGNSTIAYPTTISSSVSKLSTASGYPTTKTSASSYPTATVVTAGASKMVPSLALFVVAAVALL